MATLPPSTDFTGSSVTQGGAKTFMSTVRTFLSDLLGTDSADKSAARAALGLPTSSLGYRNKVVNGKFAVDSRAVASSGTLSAGQYLFDGWKAGASGCTYSFATSNNLTTLTISAGSMQQVIEGINLMSATYILTWMGTAQGKIAAGSYGASGVTGSVTGGTNTTIEFNTGTLTLVQFEEGTNATSFEHRSLTLEQLICARYLPVFSYAASEEVGGGLMYSSTTGLLQVNFLVPTRVPVTAVTASSAGFLTFQGGGYTSATSAITINLGGKNQASLSCTISGATAGQGARVYTNGTGKLIFTGAEL